MVRRFGIILLCVMLVVSSMPCSVLAQFQNVTTASPQAIVYAGSDFQYPFAEDSVVYEENAKVMLEITQRIQMDYPTVDEAFVLGDYHHKYASKATSDPGVAAVQGVLEETWGLGYEDILFVQGNHDPYDTANLDTTGAHDREYYGVYLINEDDFPSYSDAESTVRATSDALKAYLDEKADSGYTKPIFVITHVPLHHTYRGGANGRTDNSYARYLVDVLNEAGERGLNIVFMFGHNHGGYFDNYVGSDCVYYEPGQEIYVTNPVGGTVNDYEKVTIHFTYMNPGYLGYAPNNGTLSSTVFAIYEDRVQIARYSSDGLCNLKDAGTNSDYDCGWEADAWEVTSPQVLQLSDIILTVENSTLVDGLPIGGEAVIKIGVTASDAYTMEWVSENSGIVTVTAHSDDPTEATLIAVGGGKTIVKAVVHGETGAPAALYFAVTVAPETATVFPDGAMWVEGSGQIETNGSGETGGFVAVLSNGKIDYVPVTTEMLTGADLQTSGTYTCKVTYNGHTITDNYILTVITIPQLKLAYPSLSFESEIFYNIYFTAANTEDVVQLGLLAFETARTNPNIDNADYVTNELAFDARSGYYKARTSGISAKKLGNALYFAAFAQLKDGRYIYSDIRSFSAAAYALDRLKNSSSESMKALCVAMLNYGAAAQQYYNHNPNNLMNGKITDAQQALVEDYDESMVGALAKVDTEKEGIFSFTAFGYTERYPSVSFEGAFAIHYYFTPSLQQQNGMILYYWDLETYQNATVLTKENACGSISMTETETGTYEGVVEGIAAKELDTTIFVAGLFEADGIQYATGVLPYSLGAYCVDRANNGSGTMQHLAKATAVYGYYAKEYFI